MAQTALRRLNSRARSAWRRAQPAFRLFPFTKSGAGVVLLATAAFWYEGVTHQDLIVLAATLCCAGSFLIVLLGTLVCACIVSRRVRFSYTGRSHQLETGAAVETGFLINFPSWVPLVECHWIWVDENGASLQVEVTAERTRQGWREVAAAQRRGLLSSIRRRFTVTDVLGLCAISWHRTEPVPVSIFPARMDIRHPKQILGLGGGEDEPDPFGQAEGDRVEMRPYVPGDSPRMILWKVYARSGKLLVRLPEKAVMVHPRSCAYLVSGKEDEPSSAVARAVLEKGYLGEAWYFGADGSPEAVSTVAAAMPIIAKSGNERGPNEESLDNLARFLDQMVTLGVMNCLMFVPPTPGEWLERVQEVLSRRLLRVQIVAGLDRFPTLRPENRWERLLYRDEHNESTKEKQLRAFSMQVSHHSGNICFIDASGEVWAGLPEPEVRAS